MRRVRLIHWNANESEERARTLRSLGFEVDSHPFDPLSIRRLSPDTTDAIIIDLSRSPSQGRDLGVSLRKRASSRHIPLVYVGGDPDKVAPIKQLLPDAVYTTWDRVEPDLEHAIEHPPENPIVHDSVFAHYKGTPLPKKLGIVERSRVCLVSAPEGFEATLGDLPADVTLLREVIEEPDVAIWFVRSHGELDSGIRGAWDLAARGKLWIAWPKKSSGVVSDLSQNVVRQIGLASGLVDYKVCSIDATWSGLCFTQRNAE